MLNMLNVYYYHCHYFIFPTNNPSGNPVTLKVSISMFYKS